MAHDPRKTVPMGAAAARQMASVRKTERMGVQRDTVRDPPGSMPDMEGLLPDDVDPALLDDQAAAQRTGAFVEQTKSNANVSQALGALRGGATVPVKAPGLPASDRVEGGEVVVKSGERQRKTMLQQKIDVSRADPRRAPTQRINRPVSAYIPDDDGSAPARPSRLNAMTVGLGLVIVLALTAIVLAVMILRQRGML